MGHPLSIVLADDHAVVRAGLRVLLEGHGMSVVAEAGDTPAVFAAVEEHQPDVVVVELAMPGALPGMIPRLRQSCPGTRIVVLTARDDAGSARSALSGGADGYVLKGATEDELVEAIRRVAAGGTYLTPWLGARMAAAPSPSAPPDGLTAREAEILRLVALGHTNVEIAASLGLSVRTVESHRAHVQRKTGCTTRAELVRYAHERAMLQDVLAG